MALSRKLLFGLVGSVAATTVVVGTAVGISVSQNQQQVSEDSSAELGSVNEANSSNAAMGNKPVDAEIKQESIDLNAIELLIKKDPNAIEIKKLNSDGSNEQELALSRNSLYAFNVISRQLGIKKDVLPAGVKAILSIDPKTNTATYLNSGKLSVSVRLEKEHQSNSNRNFKVELSDFKKTSKNDFGNVFETVDGDEFVINITPNKQDDEAKYVGLDFLNNHDLPIPQVASLPLRTTEPRNIERHVSTSEASPEQKTASGLTLWLYEDTTKMAKKMNLKIEGQVKVAKLSGEGTNAYFHLVSKDENNRIKLVKNEGKETKEIAISEIKTTNLLASDITVLPTEFDKEKTGSYLALLKTLPSETAQDSENKKYLVDKKDPNLNREISVSLNGQTNDKANRVFVKPYVTNWVGEENTTNLPLSVSVSFGQNDYVSSFSTNNPDELKQLQEAGFKFGVFMKMFAGNEEAITADKFKAEDLKMELEKYFKKDNYNKLVTRPEISSEPNKFTMTKKDTSMDEQTLNIKLMSESSPVKKSQNWITFADYSYKGMKADMVVYSPVISLIRVETSVVVA